MKKYTKYIIAAALLTMSWNLGAQDSRYIFQPAPFQPRTYKINWMPQTTEGQRWTVAFRPIYLAQNGLKIDFEFELARPGDWLRIELAGHHRRKFTDKDVEDRWWGYESGWSHMASGYDDYTKMSGAGIGLGFKSMWSPRGWYYNAQFTFNFFNVRYNTYSYRESTNEDGLRIWQKGWGEDKTRFYKPEVTFNVGKHFALGRRLFLDGYAGLGYSWNFSEGTYDGYSFSDNAYAFGGRGLFFNLGFRIGMLFGQ